VPPSAATTTAIVVGGGPAGLIAAEELARAGVAVSVYDRMPSVARKFLLAGHGGLNITHAEDREPFLARYGLSADRLAPMLEVFGPDDLRAWCAGLGEPTFVGSSGRVFPQAFRAIPLVRAWLARLVELGVTIETRHRWDGWDGDGLRFVDAEGTVSVRTADATLFALGGASWPRLGSDGGWVDAFVGRGVGVSALEPANVGVRVGWSETFAHRFQGVPLKHVELSVGGRTVRGDAMVTRSGLEGGPVYALGASIRAALASGPAVVEVDLRPSSTRAQLAERLARRRPKDSTASWLRRSLNLDPVASGLLREVGPLPTDPAAVAALVKAVAVRVEGAMPIERAISTAGGIEWSEVDPSLMLTRLPGTFVAGEMLDWEAPTGGYLLQASFSTGVVAARGVLARLGQPG
jgi:uncharacterized flavoprotein (TIGR03862 family)